MSSPLLDALDRALDDYATPQARYERYAELGFELINVFLLRGEPDPVGFVRRLCDELVPRLNEIDRIKVVEAGA